MPGNPSFHHARRRLASLAAAMLLAMSLLPSSTALAKDPTHRFLGDAQSGVATSGSGPIAATTAGMPAGFTDSSILGGLTQPDKVVFAPDGKVWVLEKAGRVLYYPTISSATPVVFADLRSEVMAYWDRGLHGLAISPNYATDHAVYIQYAWDHNPVADIPGNPYGAPASWGDSCPANPGGLGDGCPIMGRISKLTATADGSAWTGNEQVLVTGWCQQFPSHSDDDLRFGPDGYLYATAGDGASFAGADYGQMGGTKSPVVTPANPCGDPPNAAGTADAPPTAEGGALRAQSTRRTDAGAVLNGAILRLDPATGNGVTGNPFYSGDGSDNRSRILAYGLRNPYRFTFRPGHSEAWIGDVGYNTWEEINRLPLPVSAANANYGWPCIEGNQSATYFGGTAVNLCTGLSGTIAPYYTYSHSAYLNSADSGAGVCPPGSSSVSGDAFYDGSAYPVGYHGALFFGDYARRCLWAMMPDGAGNPDPTQIKTIIPGGIGVVDVEAGPGGDIFYVDFDTGTIHRISYDAPQAAITSDVTSGDAPLAVHFDGSGSSGGTGTLSYEWTVPGATCDSLTIVAPSCTFGGSGVYQVRLKVTDSSGATTTSDPYSITVSGASAPTVAIDTVDGQAPPASPATDTNGFPPPVRPAGFPAIWAVGDTVSFSGHATDSDGGSLTGGSLAWQIDILHCPSNCHAHALQSSTGASGSFAAPDHDYPSLLRVTLRATDSHGLWSTAVAYLYPKTAVLTLASTPAGLALTAGTIVNATTPFNTTFLADGGVAVSAAATQGHGSAGQSYAFSSWSDGGAASHTATATDGLHLTARYAQIQTSAYLSDLTPTYNANGWGPYERDMSNGEMAAGDGHTITIGGTTYTKGLGTHAPADLRYAIDGTCDSFSAIAGIDAEAHGGGSVTFQVWLDGIKAYDSGVVTGTTTKAINVSVGGKHELRLVVDPGPDNNSDHADWANARVTCGVAPVVVAPVSRLYAPATLGGTTSTPVRTTWSATDASGVAFYELQRQVNGGAWAAVSLSPATATSVAQSLAINATYRYRVRATDATGVASAWAYGPTMKPLLVQNSSSSVKYSGTWTTSSTSAASGGSLRYATGAGAYVSYTFSGAGVSWVAYKGPIYGSAKVYIDGVYKATVSLYASSYASKPIVYTAAWGSTGSHSIKIVVVGTSGHPRVVLDAFTVLYYY